MIPGVFIIDGLRVITELWDVMDSQMAETDNKLFRNAYEYLSNLEGIKKCRNLYHYGDITLLLKNKIDRQIEDSHDLHNYKNAYKRLLSSGLKRFTDPDEKKLFLRLYSLSFEFGVPGTFFNVYQIAAARKEVTYIKGNEFYTRPVNNRDILGTLYVFLLSHFLTKNLATRFPSFMETVPPLFTYVQAHNALVENRVCVAVHEKNGKHDAERYNPEKDTIAIDDLPSPYSDLLAWRDGALGVDCAPQVVPARVIHELNHMGQDAVQDQRPIVELECDSHTVQMLYILLSQKGDETFHACEREGLASDKPEDVFVKDKELLGNFFMAKGYSHVEKISEYMNDDFYENAILRAKYWLRCLEGEEVYSSARDREFIEAFAKKYANLHRIPPILQVVRSIYEPGNHPWERIREETRFNFYDFNQNRQITVTKDLLEQALLEQEEARQKQLEGLKGLNGRVVLLKDYERYKGLALQITAQYLILYTVYTKQKRYQEADAIFREKIIPLVEHPIRTLYNTSANINNGLTSWKIKYK